MWLISLEIHMPPSLSGLWASDLTSQWGTSCALVLHGNTDGRISVEQQPNRLSQSSNDSRSLRTDHFLDFFPDGESGNSRVLTSNNGGPWWRLFGSRAIAGCHAMVGCYCWGVVPWWGAIAECDCWVPLLGATVGYYSWKTQELVYAIWGLCWNKSTPLGMVRQGSHNVGPT